MNLIEMLNTIRDNGTATYQDRIPEANRENLEDVRTAMLAGENIVAANEFMSSLLNMIIKDVVHAKRFSNPLKSLKKGTKPMGDTVREIYNNFLKGQTYDRDSQGKLLERHLPDTKTVYHRMNHQMAYPVTVSRADLSKAFKSYENLEAYITGIINSLYNSAELDEFLNMKQLIASALEANAMKKIEVEDPLLSAANGQAFIKAVKTASNMMQFPSDQWNAYLTAQATDTIPITTFSRKDEQILILDAATDTSVSVDVLASTFNMSVADFNDTKKIVIDAFPKIAGFTVRGVLIDEAFLQIFDDLFVFDEFKNALSLYTNYYLHVWQTLAFSILVNAVAFVVPDTTG